MTTTEIVSALGDIVADLSRDLPRQARYQRLLEAVQRSFPCDAIALLELQGDVLVPRAVRGLAPDALGRRFVLDEQPRLQSIMDNRGIVRFPSDSPLPDPYDGLVDTPDHHLYVHDCMGASLHVDGRTWGALTLDALQQDTFDNVDMRLLETFMAVAAATIRAADLISALSSDLQRHQQVQQTWLTEPGHSELIGNSDVMQRLRREAEVVGQTDLAVLIEGETGTGKELLARFIHLHSARADQPMVQVNCAALPESLAESELFGHVTGAFSGATRDRAGKFELADGGTLVLDEIGELPMPIQAKLLRTLQNGDIQRVGSDEPNRSNVRIIAATNRNLKKSVRDGTFREDLYHRLSVYPVHMPPLRERGDDLNLLAGHFLQTCERKFGLRGLRLGNDALRWLKQYQWPGNVRELEHAISRAVVKALGEGYPADHIIELTPRHLGADPISTLAPASPANGESPQSSLSDALEQFKKELIINRLRLHDNNLSAAARSLNMDKGNFHRQLKRLGLR
ncbi:MAG: nitric oxide reductase transcriptional regulator NorR [Pseudohongiellaceae bacterium]